MLIMLLIFLHTGTYKCFRVLKTDKWLFWPSLTACRTAVVGALWYIPVFANSHVSRFTLCPFSPCGYQSGVASRNLSFEGLLFFFFVHLLQIRNCLHYVKLLIAVWVISVSRLFTWFWWWSFGFWLTRPVPAVRGTPALSLFASPLCAGAVGPRSPQLQPCPFRLQGTQLSSLSKQESPRPL